MSATSPQVLVFQHIAIEHPGVFRDFLREDGIGWTAVELDAGEPIPDLGRFDALWVMGGPMDVWEDDAHPWLEPERAAIREAVVERKMPFFGFCLGHQLLAQALGGEVGPAATPEIGIMEVELTEAGRASPIFDGLPEVHSCLQWHSAEVLRPPAGARTLAASRDCAVQALGFAGHAFSIQYHVEITGDTVREWGAVPAYEQALERAMGEGALAVFEANAAARMTSFNRNARRIYDNFMRIVSRTRARTAPARTSDGRTRHRPGRSHLPPGTPTPEDRGFMREAYAQARASYEEGGVPVGAVMVENGKVIGRGHNRRVQDANPVSHGETDCMKNAGRRAGYSGVTMYTTLSPCMMCAGTILQFGIRRVVIGEAQNFAGNVELLSGRGVEVVLMHDEACIELMARFIKERPDLWYEDIAGNG